MKKRREMAAEMRRIEIKNNLKKVGVNTDTTTVNFDDVAQTTKLMEKAETISAAAPSRRPSLCRPVRLRTQCELRRSPSAGIG